MTFRSLSKHLLLACLAVIQACAMKVCVAEDGVLNVYSWADYIAPDTISNFEREFGIEVNYDTYDATETVEAKLLTGQTGYDVVDVAYRNASRLVPIGMFRPLDRSQLPLFDNLDPWVLEKTAHTTPAMPMAFPTCGVRPVLPTTRTWSRGICRMHRCTAPPWSLTRKWSRNWPNAG